MKEKKFPEKLETDKIEICKSLNYIEFSGFYIKTLLPTPTDINATDTTTQPTLAPTPTSVGVVPQTAPPSPHHH